MCNVIAEVHFFATKDGGRKSVTPADLFRCLFELEDEKFDCVLHLDGYSIAPGDITTIPISFLSPDLVLPKLCVGGAFGLWELGTIASGTIETILSKPSDPAAA